MSREIKFRGMTLSGKWVYGLLAYTENKKVCKDTGWFISNKEGAPFAYHVRPETVGQSTGLLDKNGIEIFAGDILKYQNDAKALSNYYHLRVVAWNEKKGCWQFKKQPKKLEVLNEEQQIREKNMPRHEIIGNIHEDGNLLYNK